MYSEKPVRITYRKMDITPELAAKWLKESNVTNRPLRLNRVEQIADAIKRKEWKFDGSPIRFDDMGRLLDGQHRLAAIEQAGKTVDSLVIKGLSADAQSVMDTGAKRTFADVLKIAGEKNSLVVAAGCTVLWRWENDKMDIRKYGAKPTFEQLHEVLDRYPILRLAAQASTSLRKKIKMGPGYIAASRVILMAIDQTDADYFFARLVDGSDMFDTDPILRLREALNQNAMSRQKYHGDHLLALMFKAWNFYRDGSTCQKLSFRPGGSSPEQYPQPH